MAAVAQALVVSAARVAVLASQHAAATTPSFQFRAPTRNSNCGSDARDQ
jgi:hypothetical protein